MHFFYSVFFREPAIQVDFFVHVLMALAGFLFAYKKRTRAYLSNILISVILTGVNTLLFEGSIIVYCIS